MINRVFILVVLCAIGIAAMPHATKAAQTTIPTKSLIKAVPYISWNEASQMEYGDKNILNPALPATQAMILKYWGVDAKKALKGKGDPTSNWVTERKSAESLEELKSFIKRGIPVWIVPMPLTPVAHPLYLAFEAWMIAADLKEPKQGLCSWMSGRKMAPLDWFQQITKEDFNPLGESLYISARIMVGYDDDREVVILHDPTFGPAWEVDYKTFDQMWVRTDREYSVMHPRNYADVVSKRKEQQAYRDRKPDEQAAYHLLYACGLSSADRLAEAEDHLAKGAAISGISKGYRHILLIELARHQAAREAFKEAIESTEKAIDALSDNYFAWEYLASLYMMSGVGAKEGKAAENADKKARKLKGKGSATRKVVQTLPSDFWIPELSKARGWGVATKKSAKKKVSRSKNE